MKMSPRDLLSFIERPNPESAGILLYGRDPMRVAVRRADLILALAGESAEAEMRLSRMTGADLRKDPAQLLDAAKAQGFFPGPRVVFVDGAGDGNKDSIAAALDEWQPGDATAVIVAGALPPRSGLRKLFEGHDRAYAAAIYDDPPDRGEIETSLRKAGLDNVDQSAMTDLVALAGVLDPGDFRQTIEKLSLYKLNDADAVSTADVMAMAPATIEAGMDDVFHAVAEKNLPEIITLLSRLEGQGATPVGLCIGAARHFRRLYAAACDPKGPAAGLARARPPVFGPSRDRLARQVRDWGAAALEQALHEITETDLALRSSQKVPGMALVERAFIRVSMIRR